MENTTLNRITLYSFICLMVVFGRFSTGFGQTPAPKILFLLADGFNSDEFWSPFTALQATGYEVVVAGPKTGTVQAGSKDRGLDFHQCVSMDTVRVEGFMALVLVGGHSPEALEPYPKALEICRFFDGKEKPIAAICHGPRLLEKAGILKDRRISLYYGIKDEVPDRWTGTGFGQRVDEAVVVDRNLITSRYPLDVLKFNKSLLAFLASAPGGRPFLRENHKILLVDAGISSVENFTYRPSLFEAFGVGITKVHYRDLGEFVNTEQGKKDWDILILPYTPKTDSLCYQPAFQKLLFTMKFRKIFVPMDFSLYRKQRIPDNLMIKSLTSSPLENVRRILNSVPITELKNATILPNAVMAIGPGFDEEVFFAMKHQMLLKGKRLAVVGPGGENIRSLNGLLVKPDFGWKDAPALGRETWIVSPGCLWPKDDSAESERVEWILTKVKEGAGLISFGFDNLLLFKREEFKSLPVASSDQTRWDFGKTARFVDSPAVWTRDRILTCKGAGFIKYALEMMEGKW